MDSEDKGFVYQSFIEDGAMIIDGQTGRIISSGYRVASVEIGHDGGGLKHKAASAIAQTGPCLSIKCSEDCCVVNGEGKGDLKVFPAAREPTNVPVPPPAKADVAELQRKLEALEFENKELKVSTGWEAVFDENSGHYYYSNSETGETTWTRPSDYVSRAQDFEERYDAASQLPYFLDKTTNESTWERPACLPPPLPDSAASLASVEPSEKTEMLAKAYKEAKSKKDVALMKELKPKLEESQRRDEETAKWKAELADLTKRHEDAIEIEDFDLVDKLQGEIDAHPLHIKQERERLEKERLEKERSRRSVSRRNVSSRSVSSKGS